MKRSSEGHSESADGEHEYYYWWKGAEEQRKEEESNERFSRLEKDMSETRQCMTELFQRMQALEASVSGIVQILQAANAAGSTA